MQERYLGDVHDFVKYALIRHLAATCGFTVGLNWYLTDPAAVDATPTQDGERRSYLTDSAWTRIDPELARTLHAFQAPQNRRIADFMAAAILPGATRYHAAEVPRDGRAAWHAGALAALAGCDAVFLDPDNGFAVPSMTRRSAPKYALFDEVAGYLAAGKTVLCVQFPGRRAAREAVASVSARLVAETGHRRRLPVIRGRASPNLLVFALAPADHLRDVERALATFAGGSDRIILTEKTRRIPPAGEVL